MAVTDTSSLTDTIPTIMEEAQYTQQHKGVMAGLCWNIKKGKGSTLNVPYFGELTANRLTEGVDMTTSQEMQDTNVQISFYEVGLKAILTDNVVEDNNEDLIRAAGRVIGDAYAKKIDQDLLALLDNGTTSLAGASTTLTIGHIAAARATLMGNPTTSGGPAPSPYAAVIHPYNELDLVDVLTPLVPAAGTTQSAAGAMADEIVRNYSVGKLAGMPIITDGNLSVDASSDVKGGVFSTGTGGGIIYSVGRQPNIETERDASLRGNELNYVGRVGMGNYLNGWTVELYMNASAPA